jgi:hypothetical protein
MSKIPHEPTHESRAEVKALASFGLPQEEIAKYIGISHPTLRKYYKDELNFSAIKANANVAKYLYNLASGNALKQGASHGDCSRAAMFWAKTRMGWRETTHLDHTSTDGSVTMPNVIKIVPGGNEKD